MAEFLQYQHIERYGNDEVAGIELGELLIFPKLDGTNASAWAALSPEKRWDIGLGSRTRELSAEADNAGFYAKVHNDEIDGLGGRLSHFFSLYPYLRLFGEWLVPHTLKTYRDDAWKRFWIFDVYNNETGQYLHYDTYKPLLDNSRLDYVPPLARIKGGDYEYFIHVLKQNVFFIEDGKGIGEGIVLKNYSFINKNGRTIWAKIINNEFKEQHHREMGEPATERKVVEEELAKKFCTEHLVTKTYAKICNEKEGWTSRYIPELLGRVYHDLLVEEIWNMVGHVPITINFGMLKHFVIAQIKHYLPHVF